jgi:putative acetyltransferase
MKSSDSILLRKIKQEDNALLAQIIRGVFIEYSAQKEGTVYSDPTTDNLFKLFQTTNSVLWIAELHGKVVGCCGIFPTLGLPGNCAELVKFYIDSSARGIGVGRALMERCILSARQLGFSQIYIESLPEFEKAISIYEKQGFRSLSKPMTKFGHPGCNLWFLKDLKDS